MRRNVATNKQELCLAVDTGSKWDGIAVLSRKEVLTCCMLMLPTRVVGRLIERRRVRRDRRYRKTRRRPERFDNRRKPEGWLAPSQKSKVGFRTRIVDRRSVMAGEPGKVGLSTRTAGQLPVLQELRARNGGINARAD